MFFMLPMIDASISQVDAIDQAPRMDEGGSVRTPQNRDITFDHVDFSYGERKIIQDVSFTVPEGTTTAIVGPSGSGKTTLTSLMARFWDVDSGSVKLGGIDVKDYALDSLMSNFSMVFQTVYLFNDSIENNIKFGKPDATHEEVVAAAKAARCHDFISALPEGYDTVIGEGGATLSGGERQRLYPAWSPFGTGLVRCSPTGCPGLSWAGKSIPRGCPGGDRPSIRSGKEFCLGRCAPCEKPPHRTLAWRR